MGGDSSPIGGNLLSQINPQFSDSSLLTNCNYTPTHGLFSTPIPTATTNHALMAQATADPFWLQKLQTVMNMNLLLNHSQHQHTLQSTAASLHQATTLSPPLKSPFSGLSSNQLLSANHILQSAAAAAASAGLLPPTVTSISSTPPGNRTSKSSAADTHLDTERKKSIDRLRLKARQHAPVAGIDMSLPLGNSTTAATTTTG